MSGMQLNIKSFIERGGKYFPTNPIVSRQPDGSLFRYTYGECEQRVRRLASALHELGVKQGDKVATLAWNTHRHFELYFAIPGIGAVLHTVNLRLVAEHIEYIINHSEDCLVFVDPDLVPILESMAQRLPSVRGYVIMADELPTTTLPKAMAYEALIAGGNESFALPDIDEQAPAGMCYTSATTGLPKGAVYTQRGIYLHTATLCMKDVLAVSERDNFLPMVPMFHANAWGIPFAAAWMGAGMILPGERPHARDVLDLIQKEQATFFAAAVSVGIEMMALLKAGDWNLDHVRTIMLGGSATPPAVMRFFHDRYGIQMTTAWGSTEMTPLATVSIVKRHQADLPLDERIGILTRQGIPCPGGEVKVLDEAGNEVPWDDQTMGEAYAHTPWQATEYYHDERTVEGFVDGWWKSGDMATVDEEGVLRLVDRAKDLIKSGGEWISSVDLENALLAHPAVAEAAVVAMPHEKWVERPLAYVVLGDQACDEATLLALLEKNFAKWWLPDHILFVDAIPKTGVGKIDKRALRERVAADLAQLAG